MVYGNLEPLALYIDVFYKGISYASAYKAQSKTVDGIKAEDINITYVRNEKPVKLMKQLQQYGFFCEHRPAGIYVYKNICVFDIQIIVINELREEQHIWLKALNKSIKKSVAKELVKKLGILGARLRHLSQKIKKTTKKVKKNYKKGLRNRISRRYI